MKNLSSRGQSHPLIFFMLISSCLFPAAAQTFRPFTALRVIETEHFRIIFPEESRPSALALAAFADTVYESVSSQLGLKLPYKLPVSLTPHTDHFNGYYNPLPYGHIVLYDTPMDPEWTSFPDALRALFTHELTHAVSLNARGPLFSFLHALFGGFIQAASYNAPMFMVEGVTVSFESLDGFGRANDPIVKQRIRQAIRDGEFLDPFQAAGVYDLPPLGAAYYEYGGLFSAYLQKRFGMAKYWEKLYKARYFRDGLVGIAPDRHNNQLVYIDANGQPTTLLPGATNRLFSSPAPIDQNRIAFIVALDGERRVGIYDYLTGSASLLTSQLSDDEARWNYIRGLRYSDGRLLFTYNHDDRFYKLGYIDVTRDSLIASFYDRDFSGGVFTPVSPDGKTRIQLFTVALS